MGLMGQLEEATVEITPANPWEDGRAQMEDAENFERISGVRAANRELFAELALLLAERVSIL